MLLQLLIHMRAFAEKILHRFFEVSLVAKGIDGVLQIIGGIFLASVSPPTLNRIFAYLTRSELTDDPKDFIVNFLARGLGRLSADTELFMGIFLIGHGIVNLFIVVGLWRSKLWAFPLAIGILSTFIFYQLYRVSVHHSMILLGVTLFEVCVVVLILHEYKRIILKVRAEVFPL